MDILKRKKKNIWDKIQPQTKLEWKLEPYTTEQLLEPYKTRIRNFAIASLTAFLYVTVLYPAWAIYITLTRTASPIAFIWIYSMPAITVALMLSALSGKAWYDTENLKNTLIVMLVILLLDLWLPRPILTADGKLYVNAYYRASLDYIVYDILRCLFGQLIEARIIAVTLAWLLVYPIATLTLLMLIYLTLKWKYATSSLE